QIADDFLIQVLVGQILVLEMRHDNIVIIGSHILIQYIEQQLGITMVDVEIYLGERTQIVDKGIIDFEFVVAQLIQKKEDFDLRVGDITCYIIAFTFHGNNDFLFLKQVVSFLYGI